MSAARRRAALARGEAPGCRQAARPEITATMQTYLDLHRHAAVRAACSIIPGSRCG
jgi:ParB family chromosome partitioning protein